MRVKSAAKSMRLTRALGSKVGTAMQYQLNDGCKKEVHIDDL